MTLGHLLLGLLLSSGCYVGLESSSLAEGETDGASGPGGPAEGGEGGEGGSAGASGASTAGDSGGDGPLDEGPAEELPGTSPQFSRLTHEQWENTVQDLFGFAEPTGLSSTFRADPREGGYLFDNDGALEVDDSLWNAYRLAASQVAERVVADASLVQQLAPDDQAESFIRAFGTRAFRRPLSEDEVNTYLGLFETAPTYYVDSNGFEAGMRVVVEAMLQSPYFIYRVEDDETVVEGDLAQLGSYEVASRLSYLLWNSMPDDELFDAASRDALLDGAEIELQARRMLDDPRADVVIESFHRSLFETYKLDAVAPADDRFPDAPDNLGELADEEFNRFIRDAVFASDGGLTELLTAQQTFVNADLAQIYGVPVTSDTFTEVELPPERRGVLTQIGFLASHASSREPDPIHRGKFIVERIACLPLPAPPDDIPALPAVEPGKTNRQMIEELTETSAPCSGCHSGLINPFGFPFENFDAIGAVRDEDNGLPLDTTATVPLDGSTQVSGALELVDRLADSPLVHECYAKHWVEYVNARPGEALDEPLIKRLGEASLTERLSMRDLIVELVTSRPFRTRLIQESR